MIRPQEDESPWDFHVRYMEDVFGRRDPECVLCGQNVYMALQGFFGGGIWTTEEADEGPASPGLNGPATDCAESPDGRHSCFAVDANKWLAS